MPHLHVISGSGAAVRRLLAEETDKLAKCGFDDVRSVGAGDWGALLSENRGRGLWSEKSAVIVEEAERMGPMPPRLSAMLEGPDADTRILLVCKPEGQSIIPKEHAARCTFSKTSSPPPWSKERDAIILGEAKKLGVGVSRGALSMMKELFEDTGELASAAGTVAGVCALRGAREISAGDVEELCLSDGNRNLLKLLDGLCAGNYADSLASLEELSARSELLPLLSALHNRFRLAMYLAVFQKERAGVMNALGAKDYAARNAETAARNYGSERLKNFVTGIIRITSNERTGQGAAWRDLSLLVIDLLSGLEAA